MPCGLAWDADEAGEADMDAINSVPCGLIWDADVALFVAEADIEALALWGISN